MGDVEDLLGDLESEDRGKDRKDRRKARASEEPDALDLDAAWSG